MIEELPSFPAPPSRRTLLGATAATALVLSATPATAKGPIVWGDMDQTELDDAYDQRVYAPNYKLLEIRRRVASHAALAKLGPPASIAYGPTAVETLDVYHAKAVRPPILIFIHGGAWKAARAREDAFIAEPLVNAGAMVVMPNFVGAVQAQGNLMTIADQTRRAVAYVYKNAAGLGGDQDRIYLMGHSSGGHLGGVLVTTDWVAFGLPAAPFKSALLGSGMYDLKPVSLSKRSKYVDFTDEVIQELSPQRHIDRLHTPLILTHGTQESPEFIRQSNDFYAAVRAAGKPVQLSIGPGYNHYETQETLGNPYGFMGRPALTMMNLALD